MKTKEKKIVLIVSLFLIVMSFSRFSPIIKAENNISFDVIDLDREINPSYIHFNDQITFEKITLNNQHIDFNQVIDVSLLPEGKYTIVVTYREVEPSVEVHEEVKEFYVSPIRQTLSLEDDVLFINYDSLFLSQDSLSHMITAVDEQGQDIKIHEGDYVESISLSVFESLENNNEITFMSTITDRDNDSFSSVEQVTKKESNTTEDKFSEDNFVQKETENTVSQPSSFIVDDWIIDKTNPNQWILTDYLGQSQQSKIIIPSYIDDVPLDIADLKSIAKQLSSKNVKDLIIEETNSPSKGPRSVRNLSLSFIGAFESSSFNTLDLKGLDASDATDLREMFRNSENITSLDLRGWDTSKVTDMAHMFDAASNLVSLDISFWDTSNVTDMNGMFKGVGHLENLDVSHFNTSQVTTMKNMFNGAESLYKINVSNFNTATVTDMHQMFMFTKNVTELDVASWDTSQVTDMRSMFEGTESLKSLDVSTFKTGNVTDMYQMFYGAKNLSKLDVSKWDTGNVEDMRSLFRGAKNLLELNVSSWNTENVEDMAHLFENTQYIEFLDVSEWDTSNVKDMKYMFKDAKKLVTLDVSKWNIGKLEDMSFMFDNTQSLEFLDVSEWDTSNVKDMRNMFKDAKKLATLDVSKWKTDNVTDMYDMFYGASSLVLLDTSGWNTSQVTDMRSVFRETNNLINLNVSGWDTSKVVDMGNMFRGARSIRNLDLSSWDTAKVKDMENMFRDTNLLANLNVSTWETANVINMDNIFREALVLTKLDLMNWDTENVMNRNKMFHLEDSSNKIIVITEDAQLQQYNYMSDNRIPIGPAKNATLGNFSDGSKISFLHPQFTISKESDLIISAQEYNNWMREKPLSTPELSFEGWMPDFELKNESTDILRDDSVYNARYSILVHNATFNVDDKDTIISTRHGQLVDFNSVPNAAKPGYVFEEWNTREDGTGTTFDPETDVVMNDIKVYAIYNMHVEIDAEDFMIRLTDINDDHALKILSKVSAQKIYRDGRKEDILLSAITVEEYPKDIKVTEQPVTFKTEDIGITVKAYVFDEIETINPEDSSEYTVGWTGHNFSITLSEVAQADFLKIGNIKSYALKDSKIEVLPVSLSSKKPSSSGIFNIDFTAHIDSKNHPSSFKIVVTVIDDIIKPNEPTKPEVTTPQNPNTENQESTPNTSVHPADQLLPSIIIVVASLFIFLTKKKVELRESKKDNW